jgi:hypothetical protein
MDQKGTEMTTIDVGDLGVAGTGELPLVSSCP